MSYSLRARTAAPIFRNSDLSVPMPLHTERCPARLDRRGVPGDRLCRCRSGRWVLEVGLSGTEIDAKNGAILVQFEGYSPCWIERSALVSELKATVTTLDPLRTPPPGAELPPDLELLRQVLSEGVSRWPRRRTRPVGGDLVLVRAEVKAGEPRPWRFLCTTRQAGARVAVLLDPELARSQVGTFGWHQARYLQLHGDPWQSLLVAFPLPDGTDDPGWAPVAQ